MQNKTITFRAETTYTPRSSQRDVSHVYIASIKHLQSSNITERMFGISITTEDGMNSICGTVDMKVPASEFKFAGGVRCKRAILHYVTECIISLHKCIISIHKCIISLHFCIISLHFCMISLHFCIISVHKRIIS